MSRQAKRNMVLGLSLLCFGAVVAPFLSIHAFAQSPVEGKKEPLAGRLAMLDPSNAEEFESQADSLRLSLQEETDTVLRGVVECYLALAGKDLPALSAAIMQLTSRWNDVPAELRPTILRLSLVSAVEERAEKRAEAIYKELTRFALIKDGSLASRRECAELVGFLNGLLGDDDETISRDVREKAESLLSPIPGAGRNYTVGQQQGVALRNFLHEQKTEWEQLESNDRQSQIDQDQLKLDEMLADYDAKQSETQAENADQRAVWTTTFATRKRLVGYLSSVIEDSHVPTPGHPGVPPVKPAAPDRKQIRVDEYKITKEKQGDRTVEVKERKSESEIEQEKDQRFAAWQRRYSVEKPIYDQNIAIYQRQLQAWTDLDSMRRRELLDLYADLTSRIDRIDKEKAEVDQAKKESIEEMDRMGDSIKSLRDKVRVWKQLERGSQVGAHDYFLRASSWEGIDSLRELQHILRWIRSIP